MSNPYHRKLSLAGLDTKSLTVDELQSLVRKVLDERIHGISFSPYTQGQGPGTTITAAQIAERLDVVKSHVNWIRTFSCSEGNELIPEIAKGEGLKTMVGVWLDDDHETNELELANAIGVAKSGHADILAVGNEVLLRGELSEDELIEYINRAKEAVPGVPVGYVDAYFKFEECPRLVAASDVVLVNCYPFWEGCSADYALLYMKDMYRRAVRSAQGKHVIVAETGWPNEGSPTHAAEPSYENAIKYFVDTCRWAEEDSIDVFWFSSFDEPWKTDAEGDVGAFWGLFDKDGAPKFHQADH